QLSASVGQDALAWGWGNAETDGGGSVFRWAYTACALHLNSRSDVIINAYAVDPLALLIQDNEGCLLFNSNVSGSFEISFSAAAGQVEILSSRIKNNSSDVRPLAFILKKVIVNGEELDFASTVLSSISGLNPKLGFNSLATAADEVRRSMSLRLSDMRGPFSSELEAFLEGTIEKYDLVVTHNNVFRPAVMAVEYANRKNVPVIMIPHAHLDDDFYHFPDVLDSALNATLVLAAPHAACDFYNSRGATARYLPAGIDINEAFQAEDVAAFHDAYKSDEPFVLVLGRNASAKGYRGVIDTVS
ncbi:glycosyl transferase family 1, partial [Pseudomonas sp. MWU13-2625]